MGSCGSSEPPGRRLSGYILTLQASKRTCCSQQMRLSPPSDTRTSLSAATSEWCVAPSEKLMHCTEVTSSISDPAPRLSRNGLKKRESFKLLTSILPYKTFIRCYLIIPIRKIIHHVLRKATHLHDVLLNGELYQVFPVA